jgi:fatty acid desaturase
MSFSGPALLGLVLLNIFLMGTNYQCVAHNFIYLPFFKSQKLNQMFSVLNSIGIGLPQSMYRVHHLNHHRYTNHPTKDESSTWRYGKNGKEENFITYSLFGMFRTGMTSLAKTSLKQSNLFYFELAALALFMTVLLVINWKLFLLVILPSYLGGQVFALLENYCEHYRSNPHDTKRDSVSCYNPVYNFIWFNNGYHQEHHFRPNVHWREIPLVTKDLPADRVIVKACHLANGWIS